MGGPEFKLDMATAGHALHTCLPWISFLQSEPRSAFKEVRTRFLISVFMVYVLANRGFDFEVVFSVA